MHHIRQLFPKRSMRLPAAALMVVVGLAFACAESPTEVATADDASSPLFKGKPGGKTNDCGFTPLRITFGTVGDALFSDGGGDAGEYIEDTDGGVHLNGATGRLMLWTSQYGAPTRHVLVTVTPDDPENASPITIETTDRIYTNGHETEDDQKDNGCGFLQMAFEQTDGSAVLEAELDEEGIVRWGKHCDGSPNVGTRVTTTRSPDPGNTWTISGTVGVHCKAGPKVRGRRTLTKVGTAGPFFMTLVAPPASNED